MWSGYDKLDLLLGILRLQLLRGEVYKAPENLVNRNFHADEPN